MNRRWTVENYKQLEQLMLEGKKANDIARTMGVPITMINDAQRKFIKLKIKHDKLSKEDVITRYHIDLDVANKAFCELEKKVAPTTAALYIEISKDELGERKCGNIVVTLTADKIIIKSV